MDHGYFLEESIKLLATYMEISLKKIFLTVNGYLASPRLMGLLRASSSL